MDLGPQGTPREAFGATDKVEGSPSSTWRTLTAVLQDGTADTGTQTEQRTLAAERHRGWPVGSMPRASDLDCEIQGQQAGQ